MAGKFRLITELYAEMAAAAMECKRLDLCSKTMFAVPNHLTEQWATEFLYFYPAASILVVATIFEGA